MRRQLDLFVVGGGAIGLAYVTQVLPGGSPVRALAAVALALIAPGYALQSALLPRRTVEGSARAALTLGLSLAATILVGLLLHVTGLGFAAATWAIALPAVTVAGCLVSAVHGRRIADGAWIPSAPGRPSWAGAAFALAGLLAVTAVVLSRESAQERQGETYFTELAIVPDAQSGDLSVDVTSRERDPRRYLLRFFADGDQIVGSNRTVTLEPGETERLDLLVPAAAAQSGLEARLYLAENPLRAYRRVIRTPTASSAGAEPEVSAR